MKTTRKFYNQVFTSWIDVQPTKSESYRFGIPDASHVKNTSESISTTVFCKGVVKYGLAVSYYMYPAPNAFFLVRELEWFLRESIISVSLSQMDYSNDPLTDCQSQMLSFWDLIRVEIDSLKCDHAAFKTQDLPLARIKKIMKLDDDIKCMMISAEAPILFAKAAELFIRELTLRAWIHTERNRRRTLQRNDIAMAVSDGDTDQFDFLIDIVPREEARGHRRPTQTASASNANGNSMNIKSENTSHRNNFLSNTNDAHSLSLGQNSGQVVVSGLSNDVTGSSTQPQTVTVALASAALAGAISVNSGIPCQALVQQNQPSAVHFTTISSGGGLAIAQSSANSGSGVIAASAPNSTTVATTAAPLQYVLQLPIGAAGASAGQPFQIQVLPQHFQTANTDTISAGQAGTILADGNTLPLVQVVSQPGGIAVPIIQEAGGSRTQILQLQMPESTAGVSIASGC
ncbi:Nuclear transcription factor Y subunit gamma [Schistosoma japonicum]|nr:Nuclear transcription factor Y subunit gamma [Schistosoma japonicum]